MTILDALNAIKTAINTALPELKRCEVHGGRFDLKELQRIATQTPSVFVSLLAMPDLKEVATGERDINLSFGIYIVTSDKRGLSREDSIINITQALLLLIPLNDWGFNKIAPPESLSSQNLYSGTIDKHGIAMWAITFKQAIRLGTDSYIEDGVLPTQLYINGELEP